MKENYLSYDVAIIGAGHAGIEAALACARLGVKTIIFTLSLDAIGNMPCNPSIGGTAKGHLVREIDALGGEMGIAADKTFLQSRMLNRGKGPAVHSLRVQSDRSEYHKYMKNILEQTENLYIKQDEIVDIVLNDDKEVKAVKTKLGMQYNVNAVIICSGTYQSAQIHVGDVSYLGGPDSSLASVGLTEKLANLGIEIRRFKTGTPSRVYKKSIDFSKLEKQDGDDIITPFSFTTKGELSNQVSCYIAYTNEKTHKIIMDNLHRSPIYSGRIEANGPRYCPSIEDKVVRFANKDRHQLFVEPMGLDGEEMYLQGMSSSLPEDVQLDFLRSIEGFENIRVMRNAYAIEYDCCNPLELLPTLEYKKIKGLYSAGQFNGTSGYEEAAAQGLVAGINAAHKILGKDSFILDRASSYIGTLIDDLVTKGCMDPYRMMTSRSEYRLILRQDNADRRLTPLGFEIGLISKDRYENYLYKVKLVDNEIKKMKKTTIRPTKELNALLVSRETSEITTGMKACDLIRRPQLGYLDVINFIENSEILPRDVCEQVEVEIKYEGYIKKQLVQVEEMRKLENKNLPEDINYNEINGLRLEAKEKLTKMKPINIGQASRISGVSPADISVLLIWFAQQKLQKERLNDEH